MNKFTENDCLPNFELKFKFLEHLSKPLTLESTRKRKTNKKKNKTEETSCEGRKPNDSSYQGKPGINAEKFQASILENQTVVAYTVEKLASFGDNSDFKKHQKSTITSVRRLQSWFKQKHGKRINLDVISKQEAPQLLKHFFLEIWQTTKENKGKEFEPEALQTLLRQCMVYEFTFWSVNVHRQ